MLKKTLFFLGAVLCFSRTPAQVTDDCAGLRVGQKMPELNRLPILNDALSEIDLSTYKGKNIILDFWHIYCSACIEAFPKMEALQQEFRNDLKVLLVDPFDTKEKVTTFYAKWKAEKKRDLSFPCIIGKRLLELFTIRGVPHYVWIGRDGVVKAITDGKSATSANIRTFIKGDPLNLPVKWDLDQDRPIYASTRMPEDRMLWYSVFIQGKIDGGSGYRSRYLDGKERGIAFTNLSLIAIYKRALNRMKKAGDVGSNPKRRILEVKDPSRLAEADNTSTEAWLKENTCTFDLILPIDKADSLYHYVWNELNRLSPYTASIQRRKIKCYALTLKGDSSLLRSVSTKRLNNLSIEPAIGQNIRLGELVHHLNIQKHLPFYVVDETGFTGGVDITFRENFTDLPTIQRQLLRYNLELVPVEREMEMFVLTDK